MFQLLTGHAPYAGRNPLEVMNQHLTAPVPAVRTERPQVSVPCEALVLRAMQKDRRHRPRSWTEMAAQIEAALAGQSLPAPASSRRTWLAVGAVVLLLALLAELAAIWVLADRRRLDVVARGLAQAKSLVTRVGPAPTQPSAGTGDPPPAPAVHRLPASANVAAVNAAMDRIAELVLDRKVQEANEVWTGERSRLLPLVGADRVAELDPVVTGAINLPQRIMESFRADIGREITVTLRDGFSTYTRKMVVAAVQDLQVEGISRQGETEETVSFGLRQVSVDEQLRRLDPEAEANLELSRGIVYLSSGQLALAGASFRRAGDPLADAFLMAMERRRAALVEALPRPERRLREWLAPKRPPRADPPPPTGGDEAGGR
jgi:hypothetical protein